MIPHIKSLRDRDERNPGLGADRAARGCDLLAVGCRQATLISGDRVMRCLALAVLLLLGGCLEAVDVPIAKLAAPDYCETPNGLVLCEGEAR